MSPLKRPGPKKRSNVRTTRFFLVARWPRRVDKPGNPLDIVRALTLYLVLTHIVIAALIADSSLVYRVRSFFRDDPTPESAYYYETVTHFQLRADANLAPNAVLFFGDSHVQGLCVSCVDSHAANYGIGGDTISGVLQRIGHYASLASARAIVLGVGFNDLERNSVASTVEAYQQLLQRVPARTWVLVSSLFPIGSTISESVTNDMLREMNERLQDMCRRRAKCFYVDTAGKLADANGALRPEFHSGDGVHLSAKGYAVWIADLKAALAAL